MSDIERPQWAERLRSERRARGWTQADAVAAMRTFADAPLPEGLLDQYKRWERGKNKPDDIYRTIIAAMYGTVVEAIFHEHRSKLIRPDNSDGQLAIATGMNSVELLQRLKSSSVDSSTLQALELTIEQLCCEYASSDATQLIVTSDDWLKRITSLLSERLTLGQHRDVLTHAGMMALLLGCLQYDLGDKHGAEATRRIAYDLGREAENSNIIGWAYEMQAWFALTVGNYRGVLAAAQAGQDAAGNQSVAVQLAAQEAKAWARMGDRRNVAQALEKGRRILDRLPYPDRPDNHFIVDPNKFDFYSMDCYRIAGDDELARRTAEEVLANTTAPDGAITSPMRNTEAKITMGVVAAHQGDLEEAEEQGLAAFENSRQSRPSLLMVGAELNAALSTAGESNAGAEFRELYRDLRAG